MRIPRFYSPISGPCPLAQPVRRLVLCAVLGSLLAIPATAQPAATHARDAEVRWANDLPLDDLRQRALLHIVLDADTLTVYDGTMSSTGQRLGIMSIDFGKGLVVDLSETVAAAVEDATGRRTLEVPAPQIYHKVKKIEIAFKKDFHDDDKLRDDDYTCKLDHRLPLEPGQTVEIFLVEGIELKFHCRDVDPAEAG